ncbi:serine/threonine protein kinase [Roseiconus nitratireducens]|uniref:Serine/threonine protein kinase n=2 Tax=Roseiconus nitratireducens TaxID=2605748 RepID=A0A5M6CX24_9BACT|nr:serine/threonine protein kinase [Roseiconus nitratireducens]
MSTRPPNPDSNHRDQQETVDERDAGMEASEFSIADGQASRLSDVSAELAAHPRYELLGVIGQGGMGTVYKARHRLMDRLVAIKVIKPELIRNAKAIQRFHREAKAAARLSHPNIVTAFDAEQLGELHLLVMEHVDGVDLAEHVKRRGPLSVPVACDYIVQVAAGLQHAFESGMVHRDIKPQNLMLISDPGDNGVGDAARLSSGTVKILDFGLASFTMPDDSDEGEQSAVHSITAIGTFMGTPNYVAPEQAQDARQADIRSDIYSLGATLHYLLHGQPPRARHGLSPSQVEPPAGELANSLIEPDAFPSGLEDVINRMTSFNPSDRFQTPVEVIQAISPFVADETVASPTSGTYQTLSSRRHAAWRKKLLGAMVLLCCAIGTLLFFDPLLLEWVKAELSPSDSAQPVGVLTEAERAIDQGQISPNVIESIDVDRDSIVGQWRIKTDQLLTPDFERGLRAVLELPLDVPAEYELQLTVSRRSNANERFGGLNIAFPFGDSKGMLAIGTHRDVGGCFIERIDGIARHESLPTWTEGFFFKLNESRSVHLRVRDGEILVLIDDVEAIRWSGNPKQIELPPGWEIPGRRSVFLGSTGEFVVENIHFSPGHTGQIATE